MAAIDTNVLIRHLVKDSPEQTQAAGKLLRQALDAGQTLYVPLSVATELEWVLRSNYQFDKSKVLEAFNRLLGTVELSFQEQIALELAVEMFESLAVDFADCIHIALVSVADQLPLWTFDKKAARVDGAQILA